MSCLPVVAAGRLFLVQPTKPEKLAPVLLISLEYFTPHLCLFFPMEKQALEVAHIGNRSLFDVFRHHKSKCSRKWTVFVGLNLRLLL